MVAPPVIDISPLRSDGARPNADACIDAIHHACIDIGFFVAVGHALDEQLERIFAAAHAFFALPQYDKEELAMIDRRGFVPAFAGRLDGSLHGAPMEYLDIGRSGANRFPDLAGFEPVVAAYQEAALEVAADILRALALALGLDPTFFAERMDDPQCFLRLMHYAPRPLAHDGTVEVLSDEHTDYGLITLLATDGVAGLEVRPRGGDWMAVKAPRGSIVVNLGDMLARWTNDRYVSTPHRAVAPADDHRYSVPFFVNPDPDTTVTCLPSCVTDERPCRYEPVTASEFLAERIAAGGYMADR